MGQAFYDACLPALLAYIFRFDIMTLIGVVI